MENEETVEINFCFESKGKNSGESCYLKKTGKIFIEHHEVEILFFYYKAETR